LGVRGEAHHLSCELPRTLPNVPGPTTLHGMSLDDEIAAVRAQRAAAEGQEADKAQRRAAEVQTFRARLEAEIGGFLPRIAASVRPHADIEWSERTWAKLNPLAGGSPHAKKDLWPIGPALAIGADGSAYTYGVVLETEGIRRQATQDRTYSAHRKARELKVLQRGRYAGKLGRVEPFSWEYAGHELSGVTAGDWDNKAWGWSDGKIAYGNERSAVLLTTYVARLLA
jgi:hypothetical protein